jgi:hypothetical protein
MPDDSPARVISIVDALDAPEGRDTIEMHTSLKFVDEDLRAAFVAYLGGGFSAGSGIQFDFNVTGYTGGGATNLDGIATVGLSVPRVLSFEHASEGMRTYKLAAGTDAPNSPLVIRPADYAAGTNEKVWKALS